MVSISSITTGTSSVQTLVDRFIAPERRPINDLEKSKTELNRRLAVFNDLKTKLRSLRDIVKAFSNVGTLNNLRKKTAVSSNDNLLTVTATTAADVGSYSIKINQIATADTGISKRLDRSGGDLAAQVSGLQEFTISIGSGDPVTISVTVDPADTNEDVMNKVRDAIQDAGIEVTASVIHDTSSTARLVIKSKIAGSENSINLTEVGGSKILSKLEFLKNNGDRQLNSGTAGGFLVLDTADLDANLTIDGVEIIKGTNEIADIIPGVTINLLHAQEAGDTSLTITIDNDTANVKSEIEKFIEKFNEVISYLNEKTKVDTVNFTRGDLTGDVVFGGLKYSLRSVISNPVSGLPAGELQFLSQIGIEFSREGTLSIKSDDKLTEALSENIDQVTNLFSSESGYGQLMTDLLDRFVSSGGAVDRTKAGIKRQISSIDTRIKNYEARLLIREDSLRRKFTELQRALSLLNSQRAAMQSFFSSNFQSTSFGGGFF